MNVTLVYAYIIMQKKINQPFMLIIYGPTGVGKTDLALAIASHMPAEIINMDVGQFYTPLSIGTAKPDWKNSPVPHHFFDIINQPDNYTVNEYRAIAYKKIEEISARENCPFWLEVLDFTYIHCCISSTVLLKILILLSCNLKICHLKVGHGTIFKELIPLEQHK